MKCITCTTEIPAAWVAAISKNECPGCAGPIMLDEAKDLMHEIASAFEKMPNDPQGLAGWLMDNYRLQKVGTGEPTGFHRKPTAPLGPVTDGSAYQNNEFIQRANAGKMIDTSNRLAHYQSALNANVNEQQDSRTPDQIIVEEEAEIVRKATLIANLQGREVTAEDLMVAAAADAKVIAPQRQHQISQNVGDELIANALDGMGGESLEDIYNNSSQTAVQKSRMNKLKGAHQSVNQKSINRL